MFCWVLTLLSTTRTCELKVNTDPLFCAAEPLHACLFSAQAPPCLSCLSKLALFPYLFAFMGAALAVSFPGCTRPSWTAPCRKPRVPSCGAARLSTTPALRWNQPSAPSSTDWTSPCQVATPVHMKPVDSLSFLPFFNSKGKRKGSVGLPVVCVAGTLFHEGQFHHQL